MNYLKNIIIDNFKGFKSLQAPIPFAIPNGKPGSGLTILVGPNNSGKSTIFDALLKFTIQKNFTKAERRQGDNVSIIISDSCDKTAEIKNVNNGSQIQIAGDCGINNKSFDYVTPRRQWSYRFGNSTTDYASYSNGNYLRGKNDQADTSLGQLLTRINREPAEKDKFDGMLRQLVPDFLDWAIESTEDGVNNFIEYKTISGQIHHAGFLGEGIISLFRIVATLCNIPPERILLLDEPELSLHPQVQNTLANLLSNHSRDHQIIIATHSPKFVRFCDWNNGAQIIRLAKDPILDCQAYSLKSADNYPAIEGLQHDWAKPHLLDDFARQLFFADRVVFVEGQEDMALFNKYTVENDISLNFEIFGYGSGGAGNIFDFLSLAKDLGIKAGAIFDGDQSASSEKCKRAFPDFKIEMLSTDDIRDKNGTNGLFNANGRIKETSKEEVKHLLQTFNDHFKK